LEGTVLKPVTPHELHGIKQIPHWKIESQGILHIFREHEISLRCSQHTVLRSLESEYICPDLWKNIQQTENRSSGIVKLNHL
jgi:hypothetical protein